MRPVKKEWFRARFWISPGERRLAMYSGAGKMYEQR
jgi:hypothetical protein